MLLMAKADHGRISDPFINANELSVQWVAEKSWMYRVEFSVPGGESQNSAFTDLVFEGLDTFATVRLNGTVILEADNMHLQHRVNVNDHVKQSTSNILEIQFASALLRGRELVEAHPEHQHFSRQTEESRIPVRKAQYNWGWDWGPILMTAGPWRPVYLEQYHSRIEDVWAQYSVSPDLKSCSGHLFAIVAGAQEGSEVDLCLSIKGHVAFQATAITNSAGVAEAPFSIEAAKLWNPLGYGSQDRYEMIAKLREDNDVLDSCTKFIGFRTCELVQEPDDNGKSFYFRINGADIFCGGSCWIPADSFLSEMTAQRYRDWIKLLADSNQVMIRVWGGGIYEDHAFLDACDELGILVWHDFAFVCGNYPAYPKFLENVEIEVRQNVRRLRSHPSLVIWAGNNEDYQVLERYKLHYDPDDRDPESWLKTTFPARYIYEHLLPKLLQEEDPGTLYHPGSPWGDYKHTTDPTVGDIHQWNIWHGAMSKYQDCDQLFGRFISEFGMEAYPHLQTIKRSIESPKQQHPGSMMMDFRNKAGDHERRLLTYVAENFLLRYDLPSFIHLTQIVQSETMRYAYKTWRRMWGHSGQRKCGGVLVWQLNDCWPTMSWAVVDYYLVKKPAFYAIARALKPLDVGIARDTTDWTIGHNDPSLVDPADFDVWVASSHLKPVVVEVTVSFISIATGKAVHDPITRTMEASPNATTECIQRHSAEEINVANLSRTKDDPYVIHASLKVNGKVEATDTAWPQPLKYLDFSHRGVKVDYSFGRTEARVSAKLPVKGFVFSEEQGLELSDNGFDIMPEETRVIRINGLIEKSTGLTWTYIGHEETEVAPSKPKL